MYQTQEPEVVKVIEPARGLSLPRLGELWTHRELIYALGRRDVAIRYKQTVVGGLWAVVQPLALAAVFSLFLGLLAKVPSSTGVPYPIFVLTGMTIWLFFAAALTSIAESTVGSADLISKVYFPRLVIPIAAAVPPMIDLLVASVVLLCVAAAYGIFPSLHLLAAPVFIALALATALGVGFWLSALVVKFRDARLLVPFLILVMMFVTPVVYPLDLIPENLQPIYAINPMVGVLEGFRWAVLPGTPFPGFLIAIPVTVSAILISTGLMYFQKAEQGFADVI